MTHKKSAGKNLRIEMMKRFLRACAVLGVMSVACLTACSTSAPITPTRSSKSAFDSTLFKGTTTIIGKPEPGKETYRVFSKAATGFITLSTVREDAERRATAFCERQGQGMRALTETAGNPPFILGNFPKIEIIFDCVEKRPGQPASGDKYAKLRELKKLLDDGVISQADYDGEKAKVLSQP